MRKEIFFSKFQFRFVLFILFVLCFHFAASRRKLLRWFPNPDQVPCPGTDGADCRGTPVCAGSGHADCLNQQVNGWGWDLRRAEEWNLNICTKDSDGDGLTNGDELGDPCCEWNWGDTPFRTNFSLLSHPGVVTGTSQSRVKSCSLEGVPLSPTSLSVFNIGQTKIAVQWDDPDPFKTCVCYFELQVMSLSLNATFSYIRSPNIPFVLCDLSASENVTVKLRAHNRAGDSQWVETNLVTSGNANSFDSQVCSDAPLKPKALLVTVFEKPFPYHIVLHFFLFFSLALFSRKLYTSEDPYSKLRNFFIHRNVFSQSTEFKGKFNCKHFLFGSLLDVNYERVLIIFASVLSCAVVALYTFEDVKDSIFVWGGQATLGRIFGKVLLVPFFLVMLPVTRYSIFMQLFGLSQDRAMKYHVALGRIITLLIILHALFMSLSYHKSEFGLKFMLSEEGAEYPILPGTVSGILFILIWIFSQNYFRRQYYGFFRVSHLLYIPAIALAVIHYFQMIIFVALSVALLAADYLFALYKSRNPTEVVGALRFYGLSGDHDEVEPSYLDHEDLAIQKADFKIGTKANNENHQGAAGVEVQEDNNKKNNNSSDSNYIFMKLILKIKGFEFEAGQYCYLFVPSLSLLPHPFSITSPPSPNGQFTLFIKNFGKGTWTDRLINNKGWEKQLIDGVVANKNNFKIYCFGPFGKPEVQMNMYKNVILVGGGIGITPLSSIFTELVQRKSAENEEKNKKGVKCDNVQFVWTFREPSLGHYAGRHMLKMCQVAALPKRKRRLFKNLGKLGSDEKEAVKESNEKKENNSSHRNHNIINIKFKTDETSSEVYYTKDEERETATDISVSGRGYDNTPMPEGFSVNLFCTKESNYYEEPKLYGGSGATADNDIQLNEMKHHENNNDKEFYDDGNVVYISTTKPFDSLRHLKWEFSHLPKELKKAVVLENKRPDLFEIINETKKKIKNRKSGDNADIDYVAVGVCGPQVLIDKLKEVCAKLSEPKLQFHIHEEVFIF